LPQDSELRVGAGGCSNNADTFVNRAQCKDQRQGEDDVDVDGVRHLEVADDPEVDEATATCQTPEQPAIGALAWMPLEYQTLRSAFARPDFTL
jgi:hypothetical protein